MEELLHKAIERGDETEVRYLIKKGASMDKLMGLRGTALCAAIADRQTDIAFYLIKSGCDVNGEDYDGEPPLLLAMRKKCFDIVRTLIKHPKCKLNKPDPLTKLTPLCFAAKFGQKEVLELLVTSGCRLDGKDADDNSVLHLDGKDADDNSALHLDGKDADDNSALHLDGKDADDNSALHLAISEGHTDIVEYLVQKGCSLKAFNSEAFTPVHTLARKGKHQMLSRLMSKWTKIEEIIPDHFERLQFPKQIASNIYEMVKLKTKFTNENPLLISARHGHSNLIKLFLMCGADPNEGDFYETDFEGEQKFSRSTPLMRLCSCYKNGLVELNTIQWLLDAGCNVNTECLESAQRNSLSTPLLFSAKHNLLELTKLFVKYGADVNLRTNHNSPLHEAILYKSFKVINYFVNECTNIDYSVASGVINRTYLHAASQLTETEMSDVVEALVSKGSDINTGDDSGETALMLGIGNQNVPFVRRLLALGADVNKGSNNLNTPLHISVERGSVDLIKLLLVHGADVNAENITNYKPLDVALDYLEDDGYKEIAVLLLQNGSTVSPSTALFFNQWDEDHSRQNLSDDTNVDDEDSYDESSISGGSDTNDSLNDILRYLILHRQNNPMALTSIVVSTIRLHFKVNMLSVDGITKLPLPDTLKDQILLT